MSTLWNDIRYGIRMLVKAPGFTAIAVITLALGIGANTAVFSVIQSVLLKGLPYSDPARLVVLDEYQVHTGELSVGWPNFLDWRRQQRSFEAMAGYRPDHFSLTGTGHPALLRAGQVSAPFFSLLGAQPILGRTFTEAEDQPGASATVVLSYDLWRNRLGADPQIAGKSVTLNNTLYTVIGVLPPDFQFFTQHVDLYMSIGLNGNDPSWLERTNHKGMRVIARLRADASLSSARGEMEAIALQLERQFPASNSGVRAAVTPLYESRFAGIQPLLFTLLAAVGCVLLIACANVANLLLARAAARQKEFGVRTALGAGRLRLVRQLLTESVLLSVSGGALGLALAFWSLPALLQIAPKSIPRLAETHLDASVFWFTFAVAILTGILFGLAPAWQACRLDPNATLKEAGRTASASRSRQGLRAGLLVAEVAMALVLVTASSLLVRSLLKAQAVNPGFDAGNLLALDVTSPLGKYDTAEKQRRLFADAVERVRNLPGVVAASAVLCPPLAGTCWGSVYLLEGRPVPLRTELPSAVINVADPDYFRVIQVPLIAGRYFTDADNAQSPAVTIINHSLARLWWPNSSPLGQRIKQGFPDSPTPFREIVGVVGDLKQEGLDAEQLPEMFFPAAQNPGNAMTLVARTAVPPMTLAAAAEHAIQAVDPDQPVSRIQPMTQYLSESLARREFSTLLLGIFGGLALLLAAIGVYGVMAYTVAQRTREFGIRMALGAQHHDVLGLVARYGARLILAGVTLGLVAAFAVTRLLAGLLFGVGDKDPVTFVFVALLLSSVALFACYLPARRATRVDPLVALRHE